ncbi:MAG: hypothetical protein J4G04_04830, partial [Nitrosopumilaceae archaeon]|nr:hypothetical protein [Nitrosopumilaceae archaeon]
MSGVLGTMRQLRHSGTASAARRRHTSTPATPVGVLHTALFQNFRRSTAHILRDAEDICISHPKTPHYREMYRSLKMIFHRAKG